MIFFQHLFMFFHCGVRYWNQWCITKLLHRTKSQEIMRILILYSSWNTNIHHKCFSDFLQIFRIISQQMFKLQICYLFYLVLISIHIQFVIKLFFECDFIILVRAQGIQFKSLKNILIDCLSCDSGLLFIVNHWKWFVFCEQIIDHWLFFLLLDFLNFIRFTRFYCVFLGIRFWFAQDIIELLIGQYIFFSKFGDIRKCSKYPLQISYHFNLQYFQNTIIQIF